MSKLKDSMRLKVKRDTVFVPDANGSVYFRNNTGTFRMEGNMIDRWIEQLLPMFNGEHTLEYLTDDLPEEYSEQIYKIAQNLYENGFVQDVSEDIPHQLPEGILEKYASQIDFLDHFCGSGGYLFEKYRQEKIAAVGSGPLFVSLVAALLESGMPRIPYIITKSLSTNRERIEELAAHARQTDTDVELTELPLPEDRKEAWQEVIAPFSAILYVTQTGDVDEIRMIHAICQETGKTFIPALFTQQIGMAGPLVSSKSDACWESAWRRLHRSALAKDPDLHTYSSTAGALLANVVVFEHFKTVTGVTDSASPSKFYLLNLETLEGEWHSFLAHPSLDKSYSLKVVQECEDRTDDKAERMGLLNYLSTLTSTETGILHVWDEGDLIQLPLSQCRVQAVDPAADGPSDLLPAMICTGFTHDEARKEAGLAGIEAYVSRMIESIIQKNGDSLGVHAGEAIGVGAGESREQALCRALQNNLTKTFREQLAEKQPEITPVQLTEVVDQSCRFYLQAFATQGEKPIIALGQKVNGFPVVWVGLNDRWHGSVGLHVTMALSHALQNALMKLQNRQSYVTPYGMEVVSPLLDVHPKQQEELVCGETREADMWQQAQEVLKQANKQLVIVDVAVEPFLKKELAGVYAILLREEGSQ